MNDENKTTELENASRLIDFLEEYPESEEFTKDFDSFFEEITKIEEGNQYTSIKLNSKKQPLYQLGTMKKFFVNCITDIQEMETPEISAMLSRIKEENVLEDLNDRAMSIAPELCRPKDNPIMEEKDPPEEEMAKESIEQSFINKGGITEYLVDMIDKGNIELRSFYDIEPKERKESPPLTPYQPASPSYNLNENGFDTPAIKVTQIADKDAQSFENKEITHNNVLESNNEIINNHYVAVEEEKKMRISRESEGELYLDLEYGSESGSMSPIRIDSQAEEVSTSMLLDNQKISSEITGMRIRAQSGNMLLGSRTEEEEDPKSPLIPAIGELNGRGRGLEVNGALVAQLRKGSHTQGYLLQIWYFVVLLLCRQIG